MISCLFSNSESKKIDVLLREELETTILEKLKEFKDRARKYNDYERYKIESEEVLKSLETFLKLLEIRCEEEKIEKISQLILDESENIYLEYFIKYKAEHLKEKGILLDGNYVGYCGFCYFLYIETAKIYKVCEVLNTEKYRKLRFKISSNPQKFHKDVSNVILILKNKDGFELARKNIGTIKWSCDVTGEIHISENDYNELTKATLMSDQNL